MRAVAGPGEEDLATFETSYRTQDPGAWTLHEAAALRGFGSTYSGCVREPVVHCSFGVGSRVKAGSEPGSRLRVEGPEGSQQDALGDCLDGHDAKGKALFETGDVRAKIAPGGQPGVGLAEGSDGGFSLLRFEAGGFEVADRGKSVDRGGRGQSFPMMGREWRNGP